MIFLNWKARRIKQSGRNRFISLTECICLRIFNFSAQDEGKKEETGKRFVTLLRFMNVSYKILVSNHYADNGRLKEEILQKAVSKEMELLAKEYHKLIEGRLRALHSHYRMGDEASFSFDWKEYLEMEECQFVNEESVKYLKKQKAKDENIRLFEMNAFGFMMMDLDGMEKKIHFTSKDKESQGDVRITPEMIRSAIEKRKNGKQRNVRFDLQKILRR